MSVFRLLLPLGMLLHQGIVDGLENSFRADGCPRNGVDIQGLSLDDAGCQSIDIAGDGRHNSDSGDLSPGDRDLQLRSDVQNPGTAIIDSVRNIREVEGHKHELVGSSLEHSGIDADDQGEKDDENDERDEKTLQNDSNEAHGQPSSLWGSRSTSARRWPSFCSCSGVAEGPAFPEELRPWT